MELKEDKKVNLETSAGGQNLIRWTEENSVHYITKKKYITTIPAISTIYIQLNQNKKELIEFGYRSAKKFDDEERKNIKTQW